jgi:hypothetical protein
MNFFCVGVMYSGEYDACDVTLSVYPHWASLKNMPGHGGNQTYDLWNTSPMLVFHRGVYIKWNGLGGLGHLTINFPLYVGHLNSIFVLGVGNLTTKFQKVQMPRVCPGGGGC